MNALSTTLPGSDNPRFRALDGVRGIAALLVVLLHVEWSNHLTFTRFVQNGYLAVDLFFILSGLVISANYATRITNGQSFRRFIGLRFFRIYPLHLAVLLAFVCLECLKWSAESAFGLQAEHPPFTGGQSLPSLLTHLFLVQGLGILPTPGWNGASWSISCEFVVYILFAGLTILGLFRSRLFLVLGVIATCTIYAALGLLRGTLNVVFDLGILRCIAGFFWGVLINRCSLQPSTRGWKHLGRWELGVTAATVIAMASISGPAIVCVIPLLIALITLLRSDTGPIARFLLSRPIQKLGCISYSVYMVHEFVIVCVLMILKRIAPPAYIPIMQRSVLSIDPWIGDALVLLILVTVLLVASRTYVWVEQPGRLFGRNLLGQQKAVRQTAPCRTVAHVAQQSIDPTMMSEP